MKPLLQTDFPTVVDSTIRSTYVNCPRKAYWEYMRHLRIRKTSIHLHFGKCFAAGLESYRLAFFRDKIPTEEAELIGVRRVLSEWGTYEESEGDGYKTLDRCIFGLQAYVRQYPPHTDHIQPHFSGYMPMVEFSFALPMEIMHPDTGDPILYCGRFDLLGQYNGQLWVVDEKTASRLGPSWNRSWIMRGQFLGYCKAALEHNIPVAGAIVRGMSILKDSYGFAEVILPTQKWKIEEWWEQLHVDIGNMVADYHSNRFGKVYGDACSAYSGCPYVHLCDTPHPERWTSQYNTVRWDPLTHTEIVIKPPVKEEG